VNEVLLGNGIKAEKVVYRGAFESKGVFVNESTPVPFEGGVVLSTGIAANLSVSHSTGRNYEEMDSKGDKDLNSIVRLNTYDAAGLEFDFVAEQDMVSFSYIFGSKEYPEFVYSGFNDIFGFFLADMETYEMWNLAVIPNTNTPITINTINDEQHKEYYVDNIRFHPTSEVKHTLRTDGFTKPLVAYHEVIPGRKYRIKMVIADVSDRKLDSFVLIQSSSFKSQDKEEFFAENKDFIESFSSDTEITQNQTETVENEINIDVDTAFLVKDEFTEETTVDEADSKLVDFPKSEIKTTTVVKDKPQMLASDSITIYFDFNHSEIKKSELQKLNSWFLQVDNETIQSIKVVGHADAIGSDRYNQVLSELRAKQVYDWLVKKQIDNKLLSLESAGEKFPIGDNETGSGRAKNRRVTIHIDR
tara:strand:- start:110 stop:1360 length:1251 start_codon:yes stop_codon:yes gene_type:complete